MPYFLAYPVEIIKKKLSRLMPRNDGKIDFCLRGIVKYKIFAAELIAPQFPIYKPNY